MRLNAAAEHLSQWTTPSCSSPSSARNSGINGCTEASAPATRNWQGRGAANATRHRDRVAALARTQYVQTADGEASSGRAQRGECKPAQMCAAACCLRTIHLDKIGCAHVDETGLGQPLHQDTRELGIVARLAEVETGLSEASGLH